MKKIVGNLILNYLRLAAKLQLKKNKQAIIIGITGSAGKTSTRLAVTTILRHKGKVKHSAHANSESGIPLNILGLQAVSYSAFDWLRLIILVPFKLLFNWEKYDFYVVEMGIDSPEPPKNMEYLLSIIHPHIGVVLNAGLVHGAAFDHLVKDRDPERRLKKIKLAIAKEKMKLLHSLPKSGVAIVNSDQPELVNNLRGIGARTLTFGKGSQANLQILRASQGSTFTLTLLYQSKTYVLKLPDLYEEGFQSTFAAAIEVAAAIGISPSQAIDYLKVFRSPRGRLRLFAGRGSTHIIDSSYNASPDTVKSALVLLKKAAGKKKKLAIIGDMRELGLAAKPAHKALADHIMKTADECLLFGHYTKEFTLPVLTRAHFPVRHFATINELNSYVDTRLQSGMWILVKGSQNTILLERVVEHLLANQADAAHLCRRGVYWDQVRKATP